MMKLLARFLALALLALAPASVQADGIGNLGFAGDQFGTVATTGGGAANTNPGNVPFAENLTPATTSKMLAGYQAMQAGTRNMTIAVMGDSTDRGVDEGAVPYNSQYVLSVAEQLASLFRGDSIASGANNWYGISGNTLADYTTRDYRVAATGATTAFQVAVPVQGGSEVEFPTAAGTWSFTPQQNTSSCDIYYQDSAAGRSFTWDVDGGAATTITTVGANTIAKATIPLGSVGTHTVRLTWVAAFVRIYGVDCQDATRKEVTVRQWGTSGGTASGMIDNTGAPSSGRLQQLAQYPVDVVFGDFGLVNSWRGNVPVATVKAQVETLIDAIKAAGGDVIFTEPPFDSGTAGNTANQQQYVDAVNASCRAKGCAILHMRQALVSKANSDAAGYTRSNDAVHYTIAGQAFRAALLKPLLRYGMGLSPGIAYPPLPDGFSQGAGSIIENSTGAKYIYLRTPDGSQFELGADGAYLFGPFQ